MDAFRGAAILLVILQHSTGIPRTRGVSLEIGIIESLTGVLAPYRMPLLLLLSGLLLGPSLNKPLGTYFSGKARKLLWPYLLWGVITAVASSALPQIFTVEFWRGGPNHLWFLTVLIIAYACAPIGRALRLPHLAVAAALIGLLIIADPSTNFYRRAIFWGAFVYLGAAARPHLARIQSLGPWFPVLLGTISAGVAWASLHGHLSVNHDRPLTFLLPIPGLLTLLWVAPLVPRINWLEAVGRRSIVYYCAHAPVAILLVHYFAPVVEVTPVLAWIILLTASVGVPALLASNYSRVAGLFEFPAGHRRYLLPRAAGRPHGS